MVQLKFKRTLYSSENIAVKDVAHLFRFQWFAVSDLGPGTRYSDRFLIGPSSQMQE
jgi:hypothetical protein